MQNGNINIELGSQPPNYQQIRTNSTQNPRSDHMENDYFPQEDEEQSPVLQRPPEQPRNSSLEDKLKTCIHKMFNVNPDRAIRIAIYLALFFLLLDFVPLSLFTYDIIWETEYKGDIKGSLEFMSVNLKTDPIMDIRIVRKESACPAGFEPLKLGVWPGTIAGCLCDNGDLLSSACSQVNSPRCKKDVPSVIPVEIYELEGSIWCGKRAVLGTDYVKKAECPSNFKECYPGGCFLGGNCPITKIERAPFGANSLSKDRNLVLTKKKGELPLINIQTTPNDIPCFNQNLYAKATKLNSPYKLSSLQPNGCDKYGFDSQFSTRLYSKSTFDFYTQNSFRNSVMDLPHFQRNSKNAILILSSRTRMMTVKNDHCLDLDFEIIQKSRKAFHHSFPTRNSINYILTGHILLLLFPCLTRCCMTPTRFFEDQKKKGMILYAKIFLGVYPLMVLEFAFILHSYRQIRIAKNYFAEYDSLGCFGEGQGSTVIHDYLEILGKGEMNFFLYFFLAFSNTMAMLVCVWHWMVSKRSSQ